jgi:hypothetical protein
VAVRTVLIASAALAFVATAAVAATRSTPPTHVTIVETATAHADRGFTGTFEATAPVCAAGTWSDIETPIAIDSRHTCADGSGTFVARQRGGVWTLDSGTGAYVALRGSGSCHVEFPPSGLPVRTCDYVAGLDDVAPSATITRLRALRRGRTSSVVVRVTFLAHDDLQGNAVRFTLSIRAGAKVLGSRRGSTTGAKTSVALTAQVPTRTRRLALTLKLVDPLGNARTLRRTSSL